MCRLGITIAPSGEMIMKSKITVNCRNPRIPITTFSYRENLIRTGARVVGLSMGFRVENAILKPCHKRTGSYDQAECLLKITTNGPRDVGRSVTRNPSGSLLAVRD